jgi:predicted ATPase/class 3 adenylate cyclase/Tfp pilus assembly protein PilF
MPEAPIAETRALLLTDVVDSTKLAETLGDAAAAALGAAHDRVARDLLPQWHGREIDKTDGMLMLFERADDALGFAFAYHSALAGLPVPLKARAGLHVGPVILRANPARDVAQGAKPLEVDGLAKSLAARVMSLAVGGQTLLTREARAALAEGRWRVQSHGHWRAKGVAEPVELFEAGEGDAPLLPPPDSDKVYRVVPQGELWLPRRELGHSLPAERDPFVGRRDELAELARRFADGARLVSVLGIGGTGKTRLALRFGWTWLGDYPGGVWFCDLSPARGLDGIVRAVAQGLQVPLGKDDPVQQLGHAIAGRGRCLVMLDNFEQVGRFAADTLGPWLDRAVQARFLVTTREVLGLPGEEALALPPLAPADGETLFMRRAAAASRDFRADAAGQAAVSRLVRLLDGLPLAIELAAARVRVMSPEAMLARMDRRFALLASAGGRRDRQATLRAAFDWSWDLLSDVERAALAQLSVFEGGFSLEAAEAVLDLSPWDGAHWVVDVVQSLLDKSLLRRVDDDRFDLLTSVQDYAQEHLAAPGRFPGSGSQAQQSAAHRHGVYFARAAMAAGATGAADLDNRIKACRMAVQRGDAAIAVGALAAAWLILKRRGPYDVAIELAQAVSGMPLGAAERARAQLHLGRALAVAGRTDDASACLLATLQQAEDRGDEPLQAEAAEALGDLSSNQGRSIEALARHEAALAMARRAGDAATEIAARNGLGSACWDLGRLEPAREHYAEALQLARRQADRPWEGALLGNLGGLAYSSGRLDEAMRCYREALAIARELGDRQREGNTLCNLGAVHQLRGEIAEARAQAEAALKAARDIGHVRLESIAQCNAALAELAAGRPQPARRHLEAALGLARRLRDPGSEGQFLGYLGRLDALVGAFDKARESLDAGERLLRATGDRLSLGLLLSQRAECELLAGADAAAQPPLRESRLIAAETGSGPESELGMGLAGVDRLLAAGDAQA